MKGVHLLIALVAFTALSSQVNGQARQRVSGSSLLHRLVKNDKKELKCYVCSGCFDASKHLSETDLQGCRGQKFPAGLLGLLEENGVVSVPAVPCEHLPTASEIEECYKEFAREASIDMTDLAKMNEEVKKWYAATKHKELLEILKEYGQAMYYKPVCTVTSGVNGIRKRDCDGKFIPGWRDPNVKLEDSPLGLCSEFKRAETEEKSTTCYCEENRCNGGPFAKPSAAVLVISTIVAAMIYWKN